MVCRMGIGTVFGLGIGIVIVCKSVAGHLGKWTEVDWEHRNDAFVCANVSPQVKGTVGSGAVGGMWHCRPAPASVGSLVAKCVNWRDFPCIPIRALHLLVPPALHQ